jgi:hypothetical protein
MPAVMTAKGSVACGHSPGKVQLGQGAANFEAESSPVLRAADVDTKSVSGCGTVEDKSKGILKCATAKLTGGTATKLTVGGQPVLLANLSGSTLPGTPSGSLSGSAGQAKLEAV